LCCALRNSDGPARAFTAGIRRVHQTWSTRRPAAPTAGTGRLTGHPGRRLSLRRVFAGGGRQRVWLITLVDRTIAAHRRLLRRVARRPPTAAAMTPGPWRLSVAPGVSVGIDPRVFNRITCWWRLFRCGFIRYRYSWRSGRSRGSAAPATAARLLSFALLQ
jgi:hypothetical protein